MQILSKLGKGATSLLLLTQNTQAFVKVGGSGLGRSSLATTTFTSISNIINNGSNTQVQRSMSTPSTPAYTLPDPAVVQPGTSPIESQEKRNPIDETCTVLIIGATRGIGLEFVKQCIQRGATVIGTYRSDIPDALQQIANEYPKSMFCLQMDVSDEDSIQNAAKECKVMMEEQQQQQPDITKGTNGGLTHIIHSAGIYLPGTSFDGTARGPRKEAPVVTKEVMMKTFEVNTIAPLLVAQNFVPLLSKRSDTLLPVISFLTSKVGSIDDNGSGGAYAYRSSKSALNNIAKSLSIDLAGEASVTLLHPGYVRTDMTSGNGLIDVDESVGGMLKAIEATDATVGFRFVDFKACLIPW